MTPADLAAALGVDVESVRRGPWLEVTCEAEGCFWIAEPHRGDRPCPRLRCIDDANRITITIPITTTLKAAVAHVRAMLAVKPPKENES